MSPWPTPIATTPTIVLPHIAIASLSIPLISASPSSSSLLTPSSIPSPFQPSGDNQGSDAFSGKATNTWIALAILFLVLCIVSTTSVTVTRFTGMNLFTWISHTSRGGRGHRGGGGLDGDQELMEEVFGPGIGALRTGRKVKVMKKPKLWDFCVGESMKEFRDVRAWKYVMPISARLKRPVTLLPAEPFPSIIIPPPSSPSSSTSLRHSHLVAAALASPLSSSLSSYPPVPPSSSIPSSELHPHHVQQSSSSSHSHAKPRHELQLTVAIIMPINPSTNTSSSSSSMPDFALGTVLLPTRCKFKDASSSASSNGKNGLRGKGETRRGSSGDLLGDLERVRTRPRARRRGSGSGGREEEEDADMRRRIMATAFG